MRFRDGFRPGSRFGRRFRSSTGPALARPSAPAFSAAPGEAPGEVVITVSALPTSWGDLTAPGDGLGEAGLLQWWNAIDGWQTLADPAATGASTVTLPSALRGTTATVLVRGVSSVGRTGVAASDDAAVPADEEPTEGNVFYVAKTGSDSNPGTIGSPRLTIGGGIALLSPGDTLIVGDGTYNEGGLGTSGSAGGGYVTIKAENKWGAHIVAPGSPANQNCFSGTRAYLVIDGFKLTAPGAHGVELEGSHHIVARNIWADGCLNSGLSFVRSDHLLIEDNLTTYNAWGGWYSGISVFQAQAYETDTTPVPGTPTGFRIVTRRNVSHHNHTYSWLQFDAGASQINVGDTLVGATSGASGTVGYVALVSGAWGAGGVGEVGLYDVTATRFQDNENLQVGGVTKAVANGTTTGSHTDGNGVIYDDWHNSQAGGNGISYPHAGLIEDCVCYMNGGKGVQIAWSDGVTVRNVTAAWNSRDGSNSATWSRGEISNQDSLNTVFANCLAITDDRAWPEWGSGRNVAYHFGQTTTGAKLVNSLSWNGTPGQSAVATNDGGAYTAEGTNLLGVDPQLADAAGFDFHPLAGSPVIDAGSSTYGFADADLEGTARTSATINLGAYEGLGEAPAVGYSLFAAETPATTRETADSSDYNLGTKLKFSVDGSVTAIRYYRHADDTGARTVRLYVVGDITPLAEVVTADPVAATGWVEVPITPVAITAGVTYIASVTRLAASQGYYASPSYFATEITTGPITAPAHSAVGNGVFAADPATYPSNSVGSFYWTDVVFTTEPPSNVMTAGGEPMTAGGAWLTAGG